MYQVLMFALTFAPAGLALVFARRDDVRMGRR